MLSVEFSTAGPASENVLPAGFSSSAGGRVPVRLLVAEDHDDTREALAMLLELEGYEVRTARNGREALDAALEFKPSLVITDFDMPELDGAGLVSALRAQSNRLGKVRILVLTALERRLIERALEAGADFHLSKPIDFQVLGETLNHLLHPVEQAGAAVRAEPSA
jgi:CheY-like chemotaxis protein